MATPPPLPTKANCAKLKRELTVFFVFLGVLLGAAGYWLLNSGAVGKEPLGGMARNLAWGYPPLAIGVALEVAGFLLLLGAVRVSLAIGGMAAISLALFYVVIMAASTGQFPINLMTLVILAIPVLVIQRSAVFLRLRRQQKLREQLPQ